MGAGEPLRTVRHPSDVTVELLPPQTQRGREGAVTRTQEGYVVRFPGGALEPADVVHTVKLPGQRAEGKVVEGGFGGAKGR